MKKLSVINVTILFSTLVVGVFILPQTVAAAERIDQCKETFDEVYEKDINEHVVCPLLFPNEVTEPLDNPDDFEECISKTEGLLFGGAQSHLRLWGPAICAGAFQEEGVETFGSFQECREATAKMSRERAPDACAIFFQEEFKEETEGLISCFATADRRGFSEDVCPLVFQTQAREISGNTLASCLQGAETLDDIDGSVVCPLLFPGVARGISLYGDTYKTPPGVTTGQPVELGPINCNVDWPTIPLPGRNFSLNDICEGNVNPSVGQIVVFIYGAALWISGVAAFVTLVYAGFLYIFSGASPNLQGKAKTYIKNVVWGLAILLLSFVTLQLINPDITELQFTNPQEVRVCQDAEDEDVGCIQPPAIPRVIAFEGSPTASVITPTTGDVASASISCREKCFRDSPQSECRELPSCNGFNTCPISDQDVVLGQGWGAPRSGGRTHTGFDIMGPHRAAVVATESGTVTRTAVDGLCGKRIYLGGNSGVTYLFCHLDEINVEAGDRVLVGDVIGRNGSTGNASAGGEHVHFEYIEEADATNNGAHTPAVDNYVNRVCANPGTGVKK